jgi:hypothetical protein
VGFIPTQSRAETHVLVRYFHGDVRCQTCLTFENWAKTAVEGFPAELAEGRLQWQPINFDSPENQHYVKDYSLADKSLVLVREEDGKTVRWKNVEEFWDFGEDQKKEFVSLVRSLIADYLKNEPEEKNHGKPE